MDNPTMFYRTQQKWNQLPNSQFTPIALRFFALLGSYILAQMSSPLLYVDSRLKVSCQFSAWNACTEVPKGKTIRPIMTMTMDAMNHLHKDMVAPLHMEHCLYHATTNQMHIQQLEQKLLLKTRRFACPYYKSTSLILGLAVVI